MARGMEGSRVTTRILIRETEKMGPPPREKEDVLEVDIEEEMIKAIILHVSLPLLPPSPHHRFPVHHLGCLHTSFNVEMLCVAMTLFWSV